MRRYNWRGDWPVPLSSRQSAPRLNRRGAGTRYGGTRLELFAPRSRRAGPITLPFPEKQDLLGAVAAVGFEMLRDSMLKAIAKIRAADAALNAVAQAYVGFGAENPALYRLMFGPAVAEGDRAPAQTAKAEAKAVLEGVILRGARSGLFAVAPEDRAELEMATLSCWSAIHGLTMLIIDAKAETALPLHELVDGVMRYFLDGLHTR